MTLIWDWDLAQARLLGEARKRGLELLKKERPEMPARAGGRASLLSLLRARWSPRTEPDLGNVLMWDWKDPAELLPSGFWKDLCHKALLETRQGKDACVSGANREFFIRTDRSVVLFITRDQCSFSPRKRRQETIRIVHSNRSLC